jgi:phosphosulfolactate synthase
MKSFEFINPLENSKPRNTGLTMALDKGMGILYAEDLMKMSGEYIDFMKFGWGTIAVHEREIIQEKIEMYKKFDIDAYPGGTLFELAYRNNKLNEYFEEAKDLGFNVLEISNGSTDIPIDTRLTLIAEAKDNGFKVISEVGKKDPKLDQSISLDERIDLILKDLEAGSDKVIVEARESGKNIGIFDSNGEAKDTDVQKLIESIPVNDIIWEAPQKNQQVYFILKIGSDVNLGNIAPDETTSLETLRRGLRGDTIGKV